METYRRGHNGADSKSVCGQPHVGSNPTVSAINQDTHWGVLIFMRIHDGGIRKAVKKNMP